MYIYIFISAQGHNQNILKTGMLVFGHAKVQGMFLKTS